jgi:glycosyltransferase involved in cell wall biosynthesis
MAPDLAAVMIARDEARCITRAIASLRPFVDRVVVLDTGSRDDTPALAAAAGAQVFHLPWPDDFSAARNHALTCADAAWNLIIDADEWIAEGGEALRAFCSGPPRLGRLCVQSEDDANAARQQARSWITRLLPAGVRFAGRVHEQAVSPLPRHDLPVVLGHDGYLTAQRAGKQARNRPLLLAELAAHPGDPYLCFQLGRDDEAMGNHADACAWYDRAAPAPDASWHHEWAIRRLHCMGQSGRRHEALNWAATLIPTFAQSPDFFFTLGNLSLDAAMADPARAHSHWLPQAQAAWTRCLALGERPDLNGSVAGRGSWLAQHNLDVLNAALAA